MGDKTTPAPDPATDPATDTDAPIDGIDLPRSDPRRLKARGDEAKAYPEHALYRLREREIGACRTLLRTLEQRNWHICSEGEDIEVYNEGGEFTGSFTARDPIDSSRVNRLVYETFDIDYDDWDREKKTMLYLWNGETPPTEPSAEPLTTETAEALARTIHDTYRWRHVAKFVDGDTETHPDGTASLTVLYHKPGEPTKWTFVAVRSRKEFRSLLAQVESAHADARQGRRV